MAYHLAIYLSAHGFGHIGQTAPVVDALAPRLPDVKLTILTAAPAFKIAERFHLNHTLIHNENDVGMRQSNALEVDIPGSWIAYRAFHETWTEKVRAEARRLEQLRPDLVLVNVPYLPLAAARLAEIPAVAMCSLDWAGIFAHYFASRGEPAARILEEMQTAYESAVCFLRPEPSMAMPHLGNTKAIGPIAQVGRNCRSVVERQIGLGSGERLVMVSLGGMDFRPPIEDWPALEGLRLIVPASWESRHPQTVAFEDLGIPFIDALASSDLLIAKPGYGSFVEAMCHGIPVLYVERANWPEADDIIGWLRRYGVCARLNPTDLRRGTLVDAVTDLLIKPQAPPRAPTGAAEAAEEIIAILKQTRPSSRRFGRTDIPQRASSK
ncbi:hypothetical protein [Thiocapsa roseopersicina]|uniref:UDP:flavonoid glycosyltransferase YjiC, YdhE family n=1 Tax=Thiocapsa roseopersicina TaxID=1058 RepID=A0A1H2Y6X1_THIRO|nr:hypothetical protein [Thiocapsa roseopersicina]SDX00309.1 UDP:flavonoid glycosyltransferase YjiC, YdhE family [Thiocapsa roseopersicina]